MGMYYIFLRSIFYSLPHESYISMFSSPLFLGRFPYLSPYMTSYILTLLLTPYLYWNVTTLSALVLYATDDCNPSKQPLVLSYILLFTVTLDQRSFSNETPIISTFDLFIHPLVSLFFFLMASTPSQLMF